MKEMDQQTIELARRIITECDYTTRKASKDPCPYYVDYGEKNGSKP